MAGFSDIVGHKQIIAHMRGAIAHDKVSHAYILNGPKLSGKRTLADAFAMALQCEQQGTGPCGTCHSCRQAMSRNHPDIIYVTHEKPNTISVDDIRTQLNGDIAIKPYSGPYKIYIIADAEKMNVAAQNALLKTIEEPPSYGIILLLTTNADLFLPTIRSRCITLNLSAVPDQELRSYLIRQIQVPDYQADLCASFAQGNVGKAIRLASGDSFPAMKDSLLRLIRKIHSMALWEITDVIKDLSVYKSGGKESKDGEDSDVLTIDDYLDLLTMWYRDVLLYKASADRSHLIFADELSTIKKESAASSYAGLMRTFSAISTTRQRLAFNVNFDLTMELLLLTMKEN